MEFIFNYNNQYLIAGGLLLFISIITHRLNKERLTLLLLLTSAFFFFLFASTLYPYINPWDERFHALVAKNVLKHPLMPTLYDSKVVSWHYMYWDSYHIWVHKQPLFLWQIALSYKIFGANEFALRLPSILLACATVFAGYRSGKILGNKNTGYYTAFLLITSFYLWELLAGYRHLDQNDVSFISYISLSLWAWLEYIRSGKKIWILLIGTFAGFAILCKWLVGLLVYLGWGVYSILKNKWQIKQYTDIVLSFLITVAIALPWQILIFKWYPAEAKESYQINMLHFTEALDGHEGSFFYHFALMNDLYGVAIPFLLLPALFLLYHRIEKKVFISLTVMMAFVYLFFSLAETRMPSFTFVVVLPVFLAIAFLLDFLFSNLNKLKLQSRWQHVIITALLMGIAFGRTDFSTLEERHGFPNRSTTCQQIGIERKKQLTALNLPNNAVLFNVKGRYFIDAMFYTGLISYSFIPSQEQYTEVKKQGKIVALLKAPTDSIPSYLLNDSTTIIRNDFIIPGCE